MHGKQIFQAGVLTTITPTFAGTADANTTMSFYSSPLPNGFALDATNGKFTSTFGAEVSQPPFSSLFRLRIWLASFCNTCTVLLPDFITHGSIAAAFFALTSDARFVRSARTAGPHDVHGLRSERRGNDQRLAHRRRGAAGAFSVHAYVALAVFLAPYSWAASIRALSFRPCAKFAAFHTAPWLALTHGSL